MITKDNKFSYGTYEDNAPSVLHAEQIQRFFNKVDNITFLPKSLKGPLAGIASMILIINDEHYQNAKDYGIHDKM